MKKMTLLILAMLMCLSSCTGGGDAPSAASSQTPEVSSEQPVETGYIQFDAYSIPFVLTDKPSTWEYEREWNISHVLCTERTTDGYRETVPVYSEDGEKIGEATNQFEYMKESGRLYSFSFDLQTQYQSLIDKVRRGENTDDLQIYSREEREQYAEEYYQTFFPGYELQHGKEEEGEGNSRDQNLNPSDSEEVLGTYPVCSFVYAPSSTFGEFTFENAKMHDIVIEVDCFGNVVGMECDYYPEMWQDEIPPVSVDDIRERMEQEESYQRFLSYRERGVPEEDMTCEVSRDITTYFDENTKSYHLAFTAKWDVASLFEGELIIDQEEYHYPLADYGGAKNYDAMLNRTL